MGRSKVTTKAKTKDLPNTEVQNSLKQEVCELNL